jgi:hypothetical protein
MHTYRACVVFRQVPGRDTIGVKGMLTVQLANHVRIHNITQTNSTEYRAWWLVGAFE